jgi:hypothetical protein
MNISAMCRVLFLLGLTAAMIAPVATASFAAERWQHHGGWGGGHERRDWGHGGGGGGGGFAGPMVGFGIGAALGAMIVAPPVYYAPPPVVYYGY